MMDGDITTITQGFIQIGGTTRTFITGTTLVTITTIQITIITTTAIMQMEEEIHTEILQGIQLPDQTT